MTGVGRAERELSLARAGPFGLDFRILAARNQPAPFALDQKERQAVISAGVSAPIRQSKALHVMREDGNSRILRGEPYNNWSYHGGFVGLSSLACVQALRVDPKYWKRIRKRDRRLKTLKPDAAILVKPLPQVG